MLGTRESSHKAKSQISSENKSVFEEEHQKQANKQNPGHLIGPLAVTSP